MVPSAAYPCYGPRAMTRWDRIGWVVQAVMLAVMVLNAFGIGRQILGGFSLGAGCGFAAATLMWWPTLYRARKSRDTWFHNAMTAKAVLESLADVMEDGDDGKRVH